MAAPGDLVRYTLVQLSGDTFVVHSEAGDGQRLRAAIAQYQSDLPGVDQPAPGVPFPPCLMQLYDEATSEPIPMDAQPLPAGVARFQFTIEAAGNYAPTVDTLHALPDAKKPGWFYYNPVGAIDLVGFLLEVVNHGAFVRNECVFVDALFGTVPCNITAQWLASFLQATVPTVSDAPEPSGNDWWWAEPGRWAGSPAHGLGLVLLVIWRRLRRGALDLGGDQTRRTLVAIGGGTPSCRAGPTYRTLLLVAAELCRRLDFSAERDSCIAALESLQDNLFSVSGRFDDSETSVRDAISELAAFLSDQPTRIGEQAAGGPGE